jgi:hypothetical protein
MKHGQREDVTARVDKVQVEGKDQGGVNTMGKGSGVSRMREVVCGERCRAVGGTVGTCEEATETTWATSSADVDGRARSTVRVVSPVHADVAWRAWA